MFCNAFGNRVVLRVTVDARFMALREIENAKERLILGFAFSPVRFATRFVPRFFGRFELIVGFRVVSAIVPGFAQSDCERANEFGELSTTPHMMRANGRMVHTSNDGRAARSANPGSHKSLFVKRSLFCQQVDVGSRGLVVSIAAEVGADILTADPYDVWSIGGREIR